jgi:hypothetical protein
MAFNINDFKSQALPFGGARPTLFEVTVAGPLNLGEALDQASLNQFRFVCRSAQLPPSALGTIEVPYFGRKIKLAGDRVFQSWQVTVMNDEDFSIRSMLEKWSNALNTIETNIRRPSSELNYKSEIEVKQYGKNGNSGLPLRSYKLIGAFPTVISPIDLDWNSTDQIENFTVTFEYDYWLPESTNELNQYTGKENSASNVGGRFGR